SELGLSGSKRKAETRTIDGRSCAVGSLFAFDVDDRYAFDVDEPIDVAVTYVPRLTTAPFAIAWDKNGGDGYGVSTDIQPDATGPVGRVTVRLDRARLAGQGILNTELAAGPRDQGA